MNPRIPTILLCGLMAASGQAYSQNISLNPLTSAPLLLNPAFTGSFDGKLRANVVYGKHWSSIAVPYVTIAASVDMPVWTGKTSYWAAGMQLSRGIVGDGDLGSFEGLVSVAFRQSFRKNMHLGIGLQGGYTQKSIDISRLYFWDELFSSGFSGVMLGSNYNTYVLNAGVNFSQDVTRRFSYAVGVSANGINQPNDVIAKRTAEYMGWDRSYNTTLSADWLITNRFGVRPSFLYQYHDSYRNILAGNEFRYAIGTGDMRARLERTVFLGLWYRSGDFAGITGGFEIKRFRAYIGYDYSLSTLNSSSNGNGGIELAIRYIMPQRRK